MFDQSLKKVMGQSYKRLKIFDSAAEFKKR